MILNRVHNFLEVNNLSFNKLEKSLGVSHGSISNAWKNKKNVGSNVIEKLLKVYPQIRAEWLLRGEGLMMVNLDEEKLLEYKALQAELNEELISKTLHFFGCESRTELNTLLNQKLKGEQASSLEQLILNTYEQHYGQELKTIKLQLMTLFRDGLDRDSESLKKDLGSKAV